MKFLKPLVILAGILLVLFNIFDIVGTEKEFFGLVERPTFDYGSLLASIIGGFVLYFGIYRIEPRGRLFGSAVE